MRLSHSPQPLLLLGPPDALCPLPPSLLACLLVSRQHAARARVEIRGAGEGKEVRVRAANATATAAHASYGSYGSTRLAARAASPALVGYPSCLLTPD
jgi:hypothetical protein